MHLHHSLTDAARIAGRHPSTLRARIRSGDLIAAKPAGMSTWTVRDDHLASFLLGERNPQAMAKEMEALKGLLFAKTDEVPPNAVSAGADER